MKLQFFTSNNNNVSSNSSIDYLEYCKNNNPKHRTQPTEPPFYLLDKDPLRMISTSVRKRKSYIKPNS